MLPQKNPAEQESTSTPKKGSSPPQLSLYFDIMSTTSHAVNRIAAATTEKSLPERSVFEKLKMLTEPGYSPPPKKARLHFDGETHGCSGDQIDTPLNNLSRWDNLPKYQNVQQFPPIAAFSSQPIIENKSYFPYVPPSIPSFMIAPIMNTEPMSDEELLKMKGPSRLIGFLVHIAMEERATRALRWTGNGLEFVLVNKELVAKMWGNRKHNTKDMDYYKLSRAIREKYDKKDKTAKAGKLKKGTRTYSYIFTEHAFPDLLSQTGKSIDVIMNFATDIGNKYHDNADLNNSNSPLAPSPQSEE